MANIGRQINWHKIRAEYVAGNISQRKLAQKYNIPFSTLQNRAKRGKWGEEKQAVAVEITQNAIKKTAESVENNALLVAEIKRKGLETISRLLDEFEKLNCTEHRDIRKTSVDIKRLKDITSALKDLTDDMNLNADSEPVRIFIDV